jgi:hypothetical protein
MLTLESIGLTQDELQERLIDALCDRLLTTVYFDDDGDETLQGSRLKKQLQSQVEKKIDAAINAIAEKHILPNVATYLENLVLQQTNEWGEKKREPVTFIEYLVQRAEHYLNETVSHDGKGKAEGGYQWSGAQTRVAYLVHHHLQYSIETAMKQAVKDANSVIVGGLAETVKMKLKEVSDKLTVGVSTGR